MLITFTLDKIGGVHFRLLDTNGFHVKAKNERFTAASFRCRQNLKNENFTSSSGRLQGAYAKGRLEHSGRENDDKMSRRIGNAQSRATFFRHSAVLSVPAVPLRKLPYVRDCTKKRAARAARLLFLIQPIKSLISGVVVVFLNSLKRLLACSLLKSNHVLMARECSFPPRLL